MKRLLFFLLLPWHIVHAQQPVTVDVCVYGGTSAGVMAAYAAKKAGKSVMLIEPGQHLGGLSAGGLGATDIGNKFAITGLARDFYRRIGKHYGKLEQWTFEPHVAENLFGQYMKEANVPVLKGYRLVDVVMNGKLIKEVTVENAAPPSSKTNRVIRAKQFIDCTYEGDLMAKAGVAYTVGREANSQYGETWNGVQLLDKHQFPDGVDPYVVPGKPESGLLYGVSNAKLVSTGSGDRSIQAYNYRMCLTDDPANRLAITRPGSYDSTNYELLLRQIQKKEPKELTWNLMHFVMMPNRKTDVNNCGGFSTDMIGANFDYADATYARRTQIIRDHEQYTKGLFYFIGHDPRIPKHLRDEMLQWGYPKDEYLDNGHFSHQLYIREARRMVGEYVMTQANCEGKATVTDGVGMAAYTMDSHNCQRLVVNSPDRAPMVRNEGDVQVGGFPSYPISYRSMVPKRGSVQNLLVPVCLSATHIAYGSIRMEPVFMVLGQSAAVAACQAIDEQKTVQDINIKRLQTRLTQNPLMNGSRPEILIDNDDTTRVRLTSNWIRETKGGKYGASMLLDDGKSGPKSVRFMLPQNRLGRYRVYVYNPILPVRADSPAQYDRLTEAGTPDRNKSRHVLVRLNTGKLMSKMTLDQQSQPNDWISLGEHQLTPGTTPYVDVSNEGATGVVVADAVLFVPID